MVEFDYVFTYVYIYVCFVCVQIEFHDVKFMQVQRRRITLTNIGKV